MPAEFREQIRSHTAAAIRVLVDALKDPDARVRVAAAKELLDRGHGKPAAVADVTLRQEAVDLAQWHLQALLDFAEKRREPLDITPEHERGPIGLGEPAAIALITAIANATANAIGVRVPEIPLTPNRVLAALERRNA